MRGLTTLLALSTVGCVLGLAAPRAHAQLGCWDGPRSVCDGARSPVTGTTCMSGSGCDSNVCLFDDGVGHCMVPVDGTSGCQYCFLEPPIACPLVSIGPLAPVPGVPGADGCTYPICGSRITYRVDTDAPELAGLLGCLRLTLDPWGDGDCDNDLIVNRDDLGEAVCIPNQPVRRFDDLTVSCGGFFTSSSAPAARCEPVSPTGTILGCAVVGPIPFGICCDLAEQCPDVPGMPARCVRLPGMLGSEGVCTYGRDGPPVDTSCLSTEPTTSCDNATAMTAYERWATGNCDADCDSVSNAASGVVCGCRPDAALLQPDASARTELDAASPLDAGSLDAGPPSLVRFGGSGCRCAAAGARDRGMLPIALALGLAIVARRRRARPRSAAVECGSD